MKQKQTKAERLASKKEENNQRRTEKNDIERKVIDVGELKFQLKAEQGKKTNLVRKNNEWLELMTRADDVVWRGSFFVGQNSTLLNSTMEKKWAGVHKIDKLIEKLKNKIEPGRLPRLKAESQEHERNNATKMLFWSSMTQDEEGLNLRRNAEKILDIQEKERKSQKGYMTIIRQSAGSVLCADKRGSPEYIRCYHVCNDEYVVCDCTHRDNNFELSDKSRKLLDKHKLMVDDTVLQQQKMALIGREQGEMVPNFYLKHGPRQFDIQIWKELAKGRKLSAFNANDDV
jgi:hypothetical protein